MDEPRFDPGGFWEFHLSGGAVHTREGRRVVVLPEDVAGPLVRLALDQGDEVLLAELGTALGAEAAASLGANLTERSPETVLGHARSVVALFGLGRLSLEQWGDALVARLEGMITDPVYEGKSMAGLIDLVARQEIPASSNVLYAHLGGQPAINAYASLFV